MKIKFSARKLNRFIRQVLLIALCLACVLEITPVKAEEVKSVVGYTWTRVKNNSDLAKMTNKDTSDGSLNSDQNWYRVLILWSGGDYFLSGTSFDGDDYVAKPVAATYGMKTGCKASSYELADTFDTRSGLNTPFIKYHNHDNDNNADTFFIGFSEGDSLSQYCLCGNISWYGCKYASLYGFRWIKARRSDPYADTRKEGGASSVSDRAYYTIDMQGDAKAKIYLNLSGVKDTWWEWHGGNLAHDSSTDDRFMIYIGTEKKVEILSADIDIEPGEAVVWNNRTINGSTVNVGKGATLVIQGVCYNNGVIKVDGGTLIVSGVLDSDGTCTTTVSVNGTPWISPIKFHQSDAIVYQEVCPGTIIVSNKGQLIVDRSGTLLTRYNYEDTSGSAATGTYGYCQGSFLMLTDSSSAYIEGVAVLSDGIYIDNYSSCRVAPGAALATGCQPLDSVGRQSYNADWLYKNNGVGISSLVKYSTVNLTKPSIAYDVEKYSKGKDSTAHGCNLFIKGDAASSFVNLGLHFCNFVGALPYKITYGEGSSYVFTVFATNINQSINSGMFMW